MNKTLNHTVCVSPNASSNASTSDGASYADAGSDACRADLLLFLLSERKALNISWFKPDNIRSRVLLW